MDLVLFVAVPLLVALALGYALRFWLVLAIGVVLGFAFLLAAYFGSPKERVGSDSGEFFGRWWEPFLVIFLIVIALIGWAAGAGAGHGLRRLRRNSEPAA